MKCMNCGKEFESVRATAKYCSDKCRADYLRKNGDLANLSAKAIDSLSARNLSARNLSARNQDVTLSGIDDCRPKANKYPSTLADVMSMSNVDIINLLKSWVAGKGNGYQYRLGNLALQYHLIKPVYVLNV